MSTRRPPPKPPDAASLRNAALRYVARYAANTTRLRRVLQAKLTKAALLHPEWAQDHAKRTALQGVIEQIMEEFCHKNYVDDVGFAANKVRSLQHQGKGRRMIMAKLQADGVQPDEITAALATAQGDGDAEALELEAARRLAKRKKLGAYRQNTGDSATLRRDYAALARAGFSHTIARQVLQQDMEEDVVLD